MPRWLLVLLAENPFQYVATFRCKVNFRIARYERYFFVSLWGFVLFLILNLAFLLLVLPRARYLKFLAIIIPDFLSLCW